jgi:peptide chain release factor
MRVSGNHAPAFVAGRIGTVLWVGDSPFRPGHNRRNWFIGVALAPEPDLVCLAAKAADIRAHDA